jgi:hypothetical protein
MKELTSYNAIKQMRGSWNGVNPVTKIITNKKKQASKNKCLKKVDFE